MQTLVHIRSHLRATNARRARERESKAERAQRAGLVHRTNRFELSAQSASGASSSALNTLRSSACSVICSAFVACIGSVLRRATVHMQSAVKTHTHTHINDNINNGECDKRRAVCRKMKASETLRMRLQRIQIRPNSYVCSEFAK